MLWSLIPYYSLLIEAENKNRFLLFLEFFLFFFFFCAVEKNGRVAANLRLLLSSLKIQRSIMRMGAHDTVASLQAAIFLSWRFSE